MTLHLCPRCSHPERSLEAALGHYIATHGVIVTDVGKEAEAIVMLPSATVPIKDTVQVPVDLGGFVRELQR